MSVVATLAGLRDARERASGIGEAVPDSEGGEANGRIEAPGGEALRREIPPTPLGPKGFVEGFRALLRHTPVVIRPGEFIVGDYSHGLHGLIDRWLTVEHEGEWIAGMSSGHTAGNIARALRLGWGGIRRRIDASLARWRIAGDAERVTYLEALADVLGLIQARIGEYADRADELAAERALDGNPVAAADLHEIARIAHRLVDEPPATFREALQWYWFYVTFERATSSGMGACRFDQVFLPFYRADLAAGRIDEQGAIGLIAALFLKEGLFYCLGGVDADGRDAVNELSWLALRAYDAVGGPSNLNVRWHAGIDEGYFAYALDILRRRRSGVPLLVNDEVVIPSLVHFGYPLRDARDYAFSGCFWWVIPGKEYPYHDMEAVSGARMLAETLRRAFRNPPHDFEALLASFAEVQREHVDRFVAGLAEVDRQAPRHYPEMVVSLVMDDTIERGRDVTDNGVRWSLTTLRFMGLATVADSLAAIRRAVYDEGVVGWPELEAGLRDDFRGHERLWRRLAECPKFGNDDPEVDGIAREIARSFKAELAGRRNLKGFAFRPAFYSHVGHVSEGRALGATPDGRRAGEPISQGPNPAQGRAVRGITAAVRSVSAVGFANTAGGPLQVHLSGSSDEAMGPALDSLVRTAFREGIAQMNVNFADRATLEDAMAHPDQHWDLVIRVTGYSARFVQIGRELQREILSRTVF